MTALCLATPARGQGGPPMVTEGTGVLADTGWEINVSGILEPSDGSRLFSAPELDVNYGVSDRVMVSVTWPWRVIDRPVLATDQAPGRVDAGVKVLAVDGWRGISLSTYPTLSHGTHRAGEPDWLPAAWSVRLPVQVSRRLGPVNVAGELAYTVVEQDVNQLGYGVVARLPVHDRLVLAGEFGGSGPLTLASDDMHFVNGGGTATVVSGTPVVNLNVSAGHVLSGTESGDPSLLVFAGVQVLW